MDTILAVTQETTLQARLVAIPHEVLFEDCLSAQVKITLQQLAALAEDNPRHPPPPLTFPRLAGLTRRSAATLRVHLAILRAYRSAVRLQHAGRGCFTLVLADWLFLPLPGHPEEQISHHVPEAIPPALTGQIIPAGWPTSPGPAGSLSVGPQTGINSLPVETTLPERNETPTVDDAMDPDLLTPSGALKSVRDTRRGAAGPLNVSPVLEPAAPNANRINILINHINQEEEVDPVKKTTESLPPPNNNNINTPITGAEPAVSPARIKDQAGPTPALPKTRSKASGVGPRQATVQRSPGGRHARHPTENHAPPSKKAGVKDNAISPASPLTLAVRQALEDSGVFSSLFSEVSRAGWSDEELLALVAWCQADNPKKPGGLFMVRLRSGLNPPESYYYPPCPNCGGTGGEHASDCSQRYISGPYASFVKH